MPRRFALVVALLAILAQSQPIRSCGFIESAGNVVTLRDDAAVSKIILFGRLANAQGGPDGGSTDLVILKTLKAHPVLEGKKIVRIPRHLPIPDPKNPPQLLLFGEVTKGEPDFFKGVLCDQAMLRYVEGIAALDAKDRVKVMRYCFDFVDHQNPTIAADAFAEFLKSTDPDICKAGRTLVPDKLRLWLQDEKTSPERLRLYAFLLANCGNQEDAKLLRNLLDELVARDSPPLIDAIFTAYTLLNPKEGWEYTSRALKNSNKSFALRYSALRAVRYFFTTQPEIIPEKDLLGAVIVALNQADMADFPVEYLRQWKCWKLTDEIFALLQKKGFEAPIIRRSVLRYALQCPDAQAARFVAEMRRTDPAFVEDTEEFLREEAKGKVE
jgi:hypothetical protein